MSQKRKKRPGPAPHFDRDEVLDHLVHLFWDRGYAATSHKMMREATGLSGSSLYNAFGDKRSIFEQVLDRYHDRSVVLVGPLLEGAAGVSDLVAWVEVLRERVSDPDAPAGCLMVATMGSPIGKDPEVQKRTQTNLERVRSALTQTLERAAGLGEIEPSNVGPLAASLTASYIGILTAAKGTANTDTALDMIDGVEASIRKLE